MRFVLAIFASLALPAVASAQSVTSAFEGFSGRSNEPVNVEADNLEVREKDQAAVFSGNVQVVQGDSTLKSKELTIYYYGPNDQPPQKPKDGQRPTQGATSGPTGTPSAPQGRDIRRLEADGNVVVTSKNQRATGQHGVFDMPSNTVVLTGGVVVSQGDNVIRGDRLHVDLTSQRSRIESAAGGGRVQGVFKPAQRQQP
ncbi:LptA/OstA family protein [Methylopila sp. Yamaguchi]|uniref:LptA/OstA family protein n=1 Tax=Methylopila sp. Yamaguchi TaxID=1437817 RepID=UPI000CB99AF0|nr:LptA/OstA family protein [Methylopila sp. Yamaguchi]GBD46973.1 OstA-like protein [Methylopila sp. Yamaguchi]